MISVIIPCYNHGHFLDDAISSFKSTDEHKEFELIIINDGSTDAFTLAKFEELSLNGLTVLNQQNLGLAAARNIGIKHAKGDYILPLDSDNKVIPEVFLEAAQKMETDKSLDVVYTDASYFGNRDGEWIVGPFDGIRLLSNNFIDACALIRKKTLIETGLYDGGMPSMGTEDWELWVNFFLHNKKFYYLPKTGFKYRVRSNSMSIKITRPNLELNRQFIYHKYAHLISERIYSLNCANKAMADKISFFNNLIFSNRLKVIVKLLVGRKIIY